MIEVHLSRKEVLKCERVATHRSMLSRASGVVNQRKDQSSSDIEIDLIGIKGELAVSKVYNTDFDMNELGVDSGIDMFVGDVGIDVKTTKYKTGCLLFKSVEAFKAPISILCLNTSEDTVFVAGWIRRDDFANRCKPFQDDGVCVQQSDLEKPESLWLNFIRLEVGK